MGNKFSRLKSLHCRLQHHPRSSRPHPSLVAPRSTRSLDPAIGNNTHTSKINNVGFSNNSSRVYFNIQGYMKLAQCVGPINWEGQLRLHNFGHLHATQDVSSTHPIDLTGSTRHDPHHVWPIPESIRVAIVPSTGCLFRQPFDNTARTLTRPAERSLLTYSEATWP